MAANYTLMVAIGANPYTAVTLGNLGYATGDGS